MSGGDMPAWPDAAGDWPGPRPAATGDASPDLLRQASEVLYGQAGADVAPPPAPLLLVTVSGPDPERDLVREVPADVPAGQLAAELGAAVGAPIVSRLLLHGQPIAPGMTLADAGVRTGSVVTVETPDGPSDRGPRRVTPQPPGSPIRYAPLTVDAEENRTLRRAGLAAGAAIAVLLCLLVGGAIFSHDRADTFPAAPAAAARAWSTSADYRGARLASVPADLGWGPHPGVTAVEPAGWSVHGPLTSAQFVVADGDDTFGLTVVTYNGRVAYPPTASPLPFTTTATAAASRGASDAVSVPEYGRIVTPDDRGRADAAAWAAGAFADGSPMADLGFHTAGPVKVLDEWAPRSGPAALVTRVQVALRLVAPGSPAARQLLPVIDRLTAAQAALASATTAAGNARNTLDAARVAAASAPKAQAAAAATALAAAKRTAASATAALNKDRAALAADRKAAIAAGLAAGAVAAGVYDVAYDHAGAVVAWAPADYHVGAAR